MSVIQDCVDDAGVDARVAEQLEIEAKYSGYIERQREEIEKTKTVPLRSATSRL